MIEIFEEHVSVGGCSGGRIINIYNKPCRNIVADRGPSRKFLPIFFVEPEL